MYLILLKGQDSMCGNRRDNVFTSIFTDSILDVAQAFRDAPGIVKVYKIDGLVEVNEIEIEIQEKTKEMA